MIPQRATIKVSKVSEEQAATSLKNHLKYLQYRQYNREQEQGKGRSFFNNRSDHVDRCWIHQSVMGEQIGNVYYHRLLLSPSYDEQVKDWRQWTRAILRDLENRFGQYLNWYAIEHTHTDPLHVHVIVQGTGISQKTGEPLRVIFHTQDFAFLRERARAHSEYENQRILVETLRVLDQCDTIRNTSA